MMDRITLEQYIANQFGTEGEHLWAKFPDYTVFRHQGSRKWFALIMDIPRNKIGLDGKELISVLNVRCDPILVRSLIQVAGFYPAYHMNKNTWITIALDGSVEPDKIEGLLDMSFEDARKR